MTKIGMQDKEVRDRIIKVISKALFLCVLGACIKGPEFVLYYCTNQV